jgi:hypothetical protein
MGNSIGVAKTKLLLTFEAPSRNLEVRRIESSVVARLKTFLVRASFRKNWRHYEDI